MELLDPRRQEYRRPFRRRRLRLDPADPLLRERLRRVHSHLVSRERLTVHPQDIRDTAKVDPRRKRLKDLLALARLQTEVGLAALDTQLEQIAALFMPEPDLFNRNAFQHRGRRLEELHRRKRRSVHKLFGKREQQPVGFRVDLTQRSSGLCEERERLAAFPPCQLPRKGEEAPTLRRMNVRQQRRPLLQVRTRVCPAGRRQRLRELKESAPVFAAERLEDMRRDAQAVGRKVV